MNKLRKGIKGIAVACFAVLIVIGTSKVVKAYAAEAAADLSVTIDTGSVILKDMDGDGAYEISNANELYAFAAAVNGGNTAINGELTANITVNTGVLVDGELANNTSGFRVWTPIGNLSNKYTGTFNGNNKTVSGLYFNNSSSDYVGMFGDVSGGTIQNLGVIDSYFHGKMFVGGIVSCIVGGNSNSTLTNCYNTGIVSGTSELIGGIVGHTNACTISDCYNSGTVIGSGQRIGGIVGSNELGTLIEKCYNTGSINISYGSIVGGVIGENHGTVANCYNTGSITNIVDSSAQGVGGVVGNNYGTVTSCYNVGSITYIEKIPAYYVGGVVGNNNGPVTSCYNVGSIKMCYLSQYCGGVIGKSENYAFVTNCFYLTGCATVDGLPQNGIGSEDSTEPDPDKANITTAYADFSTGEVAYLLQKGVTAEDDEDEIPEIWGQTLTGENKDAYPVFASEGNKVYYGYVSCADDAEPVYTNNSNATKEKHSKTDENKDGLCDFDGCNTIIDGIGGVSGNSLSLNGDVRVNFYMELDASVTSDEKAVVCFTVNGTTTEVPVSSISLETDGTYKFPVDVAAAQMADEITVQVITSQGPGTTFTYAVTKYAKAIFADSQYEATAPLMKAMLNYGTYAQHYFNYNKNLLANSVMENEEDKKLTAITSDTLSNFAHRITGELPEGVTYTGSTLLLESEVTIRHYFTLEEGYGLPAVSAGWSDWTQKGSEYYTEMPGIAAAELHEMKELTLGTWTIEYSALSYAKLVLEKDASVLREGSHDLMTALYHYNRAAVTYFKNK